MRWKNENENQNTNNKQKNQQISVFCAYKLDIQRH